MDQIIAEIKKIPPVTRFLCISSLSVTLSSILMIVSPYTMLYNTGMVFKKLQLWRLHTSFFLGGGGINYLFEFVMLYRTANDLETKSYHLRSSDLAWQTVWAGVGIIIATIPLRAAVFTRPLLVCLVYLYAALAPPGSQTSIMGLVTVPIAYYPYVMIGLDLIMGGPGAAAQAVAGAAVGHLWWWTVWGGELGSQGLLAPYSTAPEWLRKLFGEVGRPPVAPSAAGGVAAGLAQGGIHVSAPRPPLGTAPATTTTGHSWGSGRRLGN